MDQLFARTAGQPFSHSTSRRHSSPHSRRQHKHLAIENSLRIPTDKFEEQKIMIASSNSRALKTLQHFPAGMYMTQVSSSRQSSRTCSLNSKRSSRQYHMNVFEANIPTPSPLKNSQVFHNFKVKPLKTISKSLNFRQRTQTYRFNSFRQPTKEPFNKTAMIEYFTSFGDQALEKSRTLEISPRKQVKPIVGSLLRHKLKGQEKKSNEKKDKEKQIMVSRAAYFNKFLELI